MTFGYTHQSYCVCDSKELASAALSYSGDRHHLHTAVESNSSAFSMLLN